MIVTHAAAFAVGMALTALSLTGHAGPATLICTAAMFGVTYALAKPALSALIPALVQNSCWLGPPVTTPVVALADSADLFFVERE